jgi:hypothetical protein
MINGAEGVCQIEQKAGELGPEVGDKPRGAGNPTDFSARHKRRLREVFRGGLGSHQDFLIGDLGRRLLGERQLQVTDDPVDDRGLRQRAFNLALEIVPILGDAYRIPENSKHVPESRYIPLKKSPHEIKKGRLQGR